MPPKLDLIVSEATFASLFGGLDCESKSEEYLIELIPHHVIKKFGLAEFVPVKLAKASISFPIHHLGAEMISRKLKFNGICHHGDCIPLRENDCGWEVASSFSSRDPFIRINFDRDRSQSYFCEEIELTRIDQSCGFPTGHVLDEFEIMSAPNGTVVGIRLDLQSPVDEIAMHIFNDTMQLPVLALSLTEFRLLGEKYLKAAREVPARIIWLGAIEFDQFKLLPTISSHFKKSVIFAAISFGVKPVEMRQYFDRIIDNFDTLSAYHEQKTILKNGSMSEAPKLDQIQGLPTVKDKIKSVLDSTSNRFMLFCGPPGTGKTYISRSIAAELGYGFIQVKGPELLSMYVGESESNIRQLFDQALLQKPVVLLLDEIDSFATVRGRNGDAGGVTDRLVSQFATCLDRVVFGGDSSGLCIIGTTNRADLLDESLLRPGRLEHVIQFPEHLSSEQKLSISNVYRSKYNVATEVTGGFVAKLLETCFTPAKIDEMWRQASKNAMRRLILFGSGEFEIRCEDFAHVH